MLFNRKPDEKAAEIIEKAQQVKALFDKKGLPCRIWDYDYYKLLQEQLSGAPHKFMQNGKHNLFFCVLAIKLGYAGAKDSVMQEFQKYPTYEEKNEVATSFIVGQIFSNREAVTRFHELTGIDALDLVWDYLNTEPGREGRDEFILSFPFAAGWGIDDKQYKMITKAINT